MRFRRGTRICISRFREQPKPAAPASERGATLGWNDSAGELGLRALGLRAKVRSKQGTLKTEIPAKTELSAADSVGIIEVMKMTSLRLARLLGCLLLALAVLAVPSRSFDQVIGVSISVAPPLLPVYVQPVCPGPGYLRTPADRA